MRAQIAHTHGEENSYTDVCTHTYLRDADGVDPVAELFPHEETENLEGRLEPERSRYDQHFFQTRGVCALKKETTTSITTHLIIQEH